MATTKKAPAKKAVTKKAPIKKTAAKIASAAKATPKADAPAWSTIHIFGYGEAQIIGKDHNGKVVNTELKELEPLFAVLAEKQQKGTKVSFKDLHALNIFNGLHIDFMPKSSEKNNGQRFVWSEVKSKLVEKLADEIIRKIPEQKPRKNYKEIIKNIVKNNKSKAVRVPM